MFNDGAQLQLFLNGRHVDRTTIETVESVQVRLGTEGPGGFQLTFRLISRSQVHDQFLFSGPSVRKETRVGIVVMMNARNHFLMDGLVTNHQLTPSAQPGVTNLTLTGEDLTRVMDYQERDGRAFKNQSLASRVKKIVDTYSGYGISLKFKDEKHRDVGSETRGVPHQRGTDLQYIRNMAQTAGHVFFLEAIGVNSSQAYWGPEIIGNEQLPELSVDMGVATNVESLNLAFNSEQRESPTVTAQQSDDRTDKAINVGDKFAVNNAEPGSSEPPAKRQTKIREAAKFNESRAKLEGLALATRSNNAVTARGTLDTLRYGAILKPRRKIDVRGATQAFNGTWTIRSVTHRMTRGEYKQDFELVRNSLATRSTTVKRARG
jgi:hypothetical protein